LTVGLFALALAGCTTETLIDVDASAADARVGMDASPPPDAAVDAPPDAGREPLVFLELGAPLDARERFAGSDRSGTAPSIAYPIDGVLLPPNLGGLEIHFVPSGHVLFESEFEQAGEVLMLVYDDCDVRGSGCALALSDAMWAVLEGERSHGAYRVRVRGVGAGGGPIGESAPITIELADEAVTGGLYFWSTEPPAIHRYDFDRDARVSEVFYDTSDADGHCVGCHTLSRDGSTIAIGYGTDGPIAVVDVATRIAARLIPGEMSAFSPDASELVVGGIPAPDTVRPLSIVRTDGTGSAIDLGTGSAPDWSPDGDTIVATREDGALVRWDRSADGAWTEGAPLTSATSFNQFAAFAPDSEWIAFSRVTPSDLPGGVESHVWALSLEGGAERALARASAGTLDSMPRWNPSTFLHHGSRLYWITFTSNLPYGVEAADSRRRSIWMAAFDPGSTDSDPSRPAFRLPQQPETGSNFIPQWTSTVERQTCDDPSECRAGETCMDGVCVPDLM
jgi:TolB protein